MSARVPTVTMREGAAGGCSGAAGALGGTSSPRTSAFIPHAIIATVLRAHTSYRSAPQQAVAGLEHLRMQAWAANPSPCTSNLAQPAVAPPCCKISGR